MVLTKAELLTLLGTDARIVVHLASKATPAMHDYRPTPGQRSLLELVRYISMMGPTLVDLIHAGTFDEAAWTAAEAAAKARTFDEAVAAIAEHPAQYARALAAFSDDLLRSEVDMFGVASRGAHLVNWVLNGCMAYRMQLFLYLKSCGRAELNTMNLWSGVDAAS